MQSPRADSRATFTAAAWAAVAFGLVEGAILDVARAYPAILAPYKVSAHVLWVAPLLDLVLFFLVAGGLCLLRRPVGRYMPDSFPLLAHGVFVFLGVYAVARATRSISFYGVSLFALGVAAVFIRRLRGSHREWTHALQRRSAWLPLVLFVLVGGAYGYDRVRETLQSRRLPPPDEQSPNVLVIVLDTVRYDRMQRSLERSLTPFLDGLAAAGARFENVWSTSSWSLPAQASILTGCYPHEHGADWPSFRMDSEECPTLAQYFADRGYVTGAFSGNSSWGTPEYLGSGFLRFDAYTLIDHLRRTTYGRIIDRISWELGGHYAGLGKKAPRMNRQFLQFLEDYPDRPFFAYLCYMDVNQAFHHRRLNHPFWIKQPPTAEVEAAYDRGLEILDAQIGDLYTQLGRRGRLENTLVVISSDHGESFGLPAGDHDPSGHGTSLYPEQTRVPLFIWYPSRLPAGRVLTTRASLRDIPTTILQLLGLPSDTFPGTPLLPENADSESPDLLMTLRYDDRSLDAAAWDDWLYIRDTAQASAGRAGEELYDLAADPGATKSLMAASALLAEGRQRLQDLMAVP